MAEFSNKLKGLLNPSKDVDLKSKLDKINSNLEDVIGKAIARGYEYVDFTIPREYNYMKKEALQNIMNNLLSEGFIHKQDNFQAGCATMPKRSFVFFRYGISKYDGDDIQVNAGIEDATSIKIKF